MQEIVPESLVVDVRNDDLSLDFSKPNVVYSNFALVNNGPQELSLNFCLFGFPYDKQSDGRVKVPVVAQVYLPVEVAEGLAKAILAQVAARQLASPHQKVDEGKDGGNGNKG